MKLHDPAPVWAALRAGTPSQGTDDLIRANSRRLRAVFDRVDLIATPTTPHPRTVTTGQGTA